MELEYFEYLIDLTVTLKERLLLDKLGEDASNCPDVDSQAVLPLPKKHFGGSIPQGLNLMCQSFYRNSKSAG
jgi:hypothetical protein